MNSNILKSSFIASTLSAAILLSFINSTNGNNANTVVTKEIILTSTGDSTLGIDPKANVDTSLPHEVEVHGNDPTYIYKNVVSIFKQDDFTTTNLETTFTTSNDSADKQFTFKGDPSLAKALSGSSIEAVNISNNHIHDYGQQGLNDTLNALNAVGVHYFGEGNVYKTQIKGIKFCFLGYQGWDYTAEFKNKIYNDVKTAKNEGYNVVINFHWGVERAYTPDEEQIEVAHYAIDCGADLIIGHHPHVIESVEEYRGKMICYSLGNFAFGGNSNPSDKESMIVQTKFVFKNDKLKQTGFRVIPIRISSVTYRNDYCPTPVSGTDEGNATLKKLNGLSPNIDFTIGENYHFINAN